MTPLEKIVTPQSFCSFQNPKMSPKIGDPPEKTCDPPEKNSDPPEKNSDPPGKNCDPLKNRSGAKHRKILGILDHI